jgi:hypothetical protein
MDTLKLLSALNSGWPTLGTPPEAALLWPLFRLLLQCLPLGHLFAAWAVGLALGAASASDAGSATSAATSNESSARMRTGRCDIRQRPPIGCDGARSLSPLERRGDA